MIATIGRALFWIAAAWLVLSILFVVAWGFLMRAIEPPHEEEETHRRDATRGESAETANIRRAA